MGCYQPELTEEEWKTVEIPMEGGKMPLPRNGVYISKERCQRDFPNHKIIEYGGDINDISDIENLGGMENLVYIDMIQDVPKIKRLLRNKRKRKKQPAFKP